MIYKRTIIAPTGARRYTPTIRLSGEWLKLLGFEVGKVVRITGGPGSIILEVEQDREFQAIHRSRHARKGRPLDAC